MKEKNQVVPDEVLSKEFLSQFKTEADVSKFLKQLHAQVLEKMLEGEMDAHLGYEKNSVTGNNTGNSRNGSYPKKIQTEHGESVISIPRDRNGQFEPIAVPKHESRGLSIEKLVISLYAKGMSVSDIEEEMREIYEIELSTSAISIITNKVNQAAQEWQNRPLDPVCLIVWMDGIVFKVRDNGKIINKRRTETERPEGSSWHVGWQIGKLFFLDGCPDRLKSPWSAGYTDYLYRQSEWIYGYYPQCIPSVIHSSLCGTSDQKFL